MAIRDYSERAVVTLRGEQTIEEAALLMKKHHIGFLVVVDSKETGGAPKPIGVVTDRDLVNSVVASGVDESLVTVADVMTSTVRAIRDEAGVLETIREMRKFAVRRMPVVDARGGLVGIVSVDDLLLLLADELLQISQISREQRRHEEKAVTIL